MNSQKISRVAVFLFSAHHRADPRPAAPRLALRRPHRLLQLAFALELRVDMSSQDITYLDGSIRYKELIAKENKARSQWKEKFGSAPPCWRPVEPFEAASCSRSSLESPTKPPKLAEEYPELVLWDPGTAPHYDYSIAARTTR